MSFGRLERSASAKPMSDINVTPLVDVTLVLLVIFMIAAPLLANAIRLDLPQSSAARPLEQTPSITLAINKAGQLFLQNEPLSLEQLGQHLQPLGASQPDTEVHLRADASVPYGRVIEVMGMAQKAGLTRIGFMTEADAPEKN